MPSNGKDNLILFPGSVDYYQFELTRLLETERYREAVRMLRMLVSCETGDQTLTEEWQMLLQWLEQQPGMDDAPPNVEEESEENESALLERHLQEKQARESRYVENLLEALVHSANFEQKWLALEQLVHVNDPRAAARIAAWLEKEPLPPAIQSRVLQMLRQLKWQGSVSLHRLGETVSLSAYDLPASIEEMPAELISVMDLVLDVAEQQQPGLIVFASQVWENVVLAACGTSRYEELCDLARSAPKITAAALHLASDLTSSLDADSTLLDWYGLEPEEKKNVLEAAAMLSGVLEARS